MVEREDRKAVGSVGDGGTYKAFKGEVGEGGLAEVWVVSSYTRIYMERGLPEEKKEIRFVQPHANAHSCS